MWTEIRYMIITAYDIYMYIYIYKYYMYIVHTFFCTLLHMTNSAHGMPSGAHDPGKRWRCRTSVGDFLPPRVFGENFGKLSSV